MSLADFEIVKTSTGAMSIRNIRVNEIMHNPVGPWAEANALYVDQSHLRSRLQEASHEPLVLFDVGLGAASNALAAIKAALDLGAAQLRKLHIVSYENNLSLLEFARQNSQAFSHMNGFDSALGSILVSHSWRSACGMISWDLRRGDFLDTVAAETLTADLIFYDPYSPAVNNPMWTFETFRKLRQRCHVADTTPGTFLCTYSVATPVRAAMLLAGFFVGHGAPTGLKEETTQAATNLATLAVPLSERWMVRWRRSHTPLPYDAPACDREVWLDRIRKHEQFAR